MFAAIGAILSSIFSGIVSPLFSYLGNAQNVSLAEFQAATAEQQANYLNYVTALNTSNQIKASANTWTGAHLMVYLFGVPAAVHWGCLIFVSTFPQLSGDWKVLALPAPFASSEISIILSFFVLAPALPLAGAATAWLTSKAAK